MSKVTEEQAELEKLFGKPKNLDDLRGDGSNLAQSKKRDGLLKTGIMVIIFGMLAMTTWIFGETHLTKFAMPIAAKITVTESAQLGMATFIAGLFATLFSDGMARIWPWLMRKYGETNEQRIASKVGGNFGIFSSFYFTGSVLVEQFPRAFSPQMIEMLSFIGAIMFVLSAIITGICATVFFGKDLLTMEMDEIIKSSSMVKSESLANTKSIREQALIKAKQSVEKDRVKYEQIMADQMDLEMRYSIISEIPNPSIRQKMLADHLSDLTIIEGEFDELPAPKRETDKGKK